MSNYKDMISDEEIRNLLNWRMLEQGADESHMEEILMDMESKIVFAMEPALPFPMHREKELLNKLDKKFAAKVGLKWMFIGIGLVTSVAYLSMRSTDRSELSNNSLVPVLPRQSAQMFVDSGSPDAAVDEKNRNILVLPATDNIEGGFAVNPTDEYQNPFTPETFWPFGMPQNGKTEELDTPKQVWSTNQNSANGKIYNHSSEKHHMVIDTLFEGVKRIEILANMCNVNIEAGPVDDVSVKGDIKTEKKGIYVNQPDYSFFYERNGEILSVWIKNTGRNKTLIIGTLIFKGALNFIVPVKTDVVLKNMSGDIHVKGLGGTVCELESTYGNAFLEELHTDVKFRSMSGDLHMQGIEGKVKAESAYGQQVFSHIKGDLTSASSSGDVKVEDLNGNLTVTANYGNIELSEIRGDLTIINRSGNISGKDIEGKTCSVKANYGAVKFSNIKSDMEVDSKSGDVILTQVLGRVTSKTSYGHQVLSGIIGDIHAKSSSGDIRISASEGNADLALSYGNVDFQDFKGDIKVVSNSGYIRGKNIELLSKMELKAVYGDISMQLKNRIDDLSFDLTSSMGHIKVDKEGAKHRKENGAVLIEKGLIHIKGTTLSGDQTYN